MTRAAAALLALAVLAALAAVALLPGLERGEFWPSAVCATLAGWAFLALERLATPRRHPR